MVLLFALSGRVCFLNGYRKDMLIFNMRQMFAAKFFYPSCATTFLNSGG